jgi:hypothetical protein
MALAQREPTAAGFHAWRKRVKDHWYHTRLLNPIRPCVLTPHRKAALELSEQLGAHHDLAVLNAGLSGGAGRLSDSGVLQILLERLQQQMLEFESESLSLGRTVFARKPNDVCRRWHAYWDKWRESKRGKKKNRRRSCR